MRKSLLTFVLVVVVVHISTAQAQRLVLAEEFTSASCSFSALQDPHFDSALNKNAGRVVAIKYHNNWGNGPSGSMDPMYNANLSQTNNRGYYYNTPFVPYTILDGTRFKSHVANFKEESIDSAYKIKTPFKILVEKSFSKYNDSIIAHATIICDWYEQVNIKNLVAHVVIIERNVDFVSAPSSSGAKHFEGVMKMMLPNEYGTPLDSIWDQGEKVELVYKWKLKGQYNKSLVYNAHQLAVLVFV